MTAPVPGKTVSAASQSAPRRSTPAAPREAGARAAARADPAPVSLGLLREILGFHIARARLTTVDSFDRHVGEPLGLRRVEYSLLLLLLANGPLSPKRLGQALALSAPNLTLLLDRLQARGLIRRERSPTDGRSQNIVLTSDGLALADAGAAAAGPMERELDDRLTHAERLMLIELLRKVAG